MEKELLHYWIKVFEIIAQNRTKREPLKESITEKCPCDADHIGSIQITIDYRYDGLCKIKVYIVGDKHPKCTFPKEMTAELTREQFLDKVSAIAQ
ncbi:hypothetical protein GF369_03950 [Candidatus Peregrinibacteria bacterium]|nr:hypothetical protein [Candidatus Peregrinibacteria bacterium]